MSYLSTYPVSGSDLCVQVMLEYEEDVMKVNEAWIFGAFFLGLALGVLVTALLVPCCLRSLAKKQVQDEEELLEEKDRDRHGGDVIHAYNVPSKTTTISFTRKQVKGKGRFGRKSMAGVEEEEEDFGDTMVGPDGRTLPVDPSQSHGIGDILVQPTVEEAEAEMSSQDVDKVNRITQDQRREKDDMFLKMLKKQLMKMKVAGPTMADIVNDVQDDLRNKMRIYQDEKDEVEEETRKQHSKDKDTQALDNECDKLDANLEQKLGHLHEDERQYIRTQLGNRTDLTDEQIEALLASLLKDMANLEKRLGDDWNRQNRNLEERLAKRKQIIAFRKLQDEQAKQVVEDNIKELEENTEELVRNGGIKAADRDKIINEYKQDLYKLNVLHDKETNRMASDLAEKLRQRRMKRMLQLKNRHENDRAVTLERMDRGLDTGDLIQGYHDLVQQQTNETEVTETELDQKEIQEIDNFKQKRASDKAAQIEDRTQQILQHLKVHGANEFDAEKIIQLHRARMEQLDERRMMERNRMAAKLREQWERKMQQLDEEEQKTHQDQETRVEQQASTVNRVLSTSIELTDDAKRKILKEHEHSMQVLNNQLDKSKTRQQRNIELKINQRRAKMAALRKEKEDALAVKAKASQQERDKLQQQMEAEIAIEEKKLEEEKQKALNALRRRLGIETEEALRRQEQELSVLIGRLEVGSARRQAILQKQDTMIQNLQEQLETKIAKGGMQMSGTDQLIQQHYNQVEHLNDKLQQSREHQEQMIKEKVQSMKLQKQHDLKEQITEEKVLTRRNSSLRRSGTSKASDVLNAMFMEQKHNRQVEELEQEMKVELERSKEELNRQLEQELQSELQEQKKHLLSSLATQSRMSRGELQDAVDAAVTETGGNKTAAKKLARDLQQSLERARTDMTMDQDDDDYIGTDSRRRPSSGLDRRPKSGVKKGAKKRGSLAPAKNVWSDDDDDGF